MPTSESGLPALHWIKPLNAELNPICHLLSLLVGATIVVVSRLRVKRKHQHLLRVTLLFKVKKCKPTDDFYYFFLLNSLNSFQSISCVKIGLHTSLHLFTTKPSSGHYSFKLCLSYDTSTTFSKPSCRKNAIQCFIFQFPATFRFPISSIAAVAFFLVFHSLFTSIFPPVTCLRRQFLRLMWSSISLSLLLFFLFPSSLTLCNTSSFRTHAVQLMSIFLDHHISKLSSHFRSTFQSVQFSAPKNSSPTAHKSQVNLYFSIYYQDILDYI